MSHRAFDAALAFDRIESPYNPRRWQISSVSADWFIEFLLEIAELPLVTGFIKNFGPAILISPTKFPAAKSMVG